MEATTDTNQKPLEIGQIVQYRKVGTFRVTGNREGWTEAKYVEFRGAGWYLCEAVKAPKKYREAGEIALWVGPENVVEG